MRLSRLGLALLACWGPGSEQVHDLFDDVLAGVSLSSGDDFVLTTWHEGESLEEAVSYFSITALPADAYQDSRETWIIATVGGPSLKSRIMSSL